MHHNKPSKLDEYYDIIKTKLSLRGSNVRAFYEYIKDEVDSIIGTYSNFNKYVKSKGLKPKKPVKGHPRYETDMCVQAQVDWKKDITIHNRYGEPFTFRYLIINWVILDSPSLLTNFIEQSRMYLTA